MKSNWRSFCVRISMTVALWGASLGTSDEADALTVRDILVMHEQGIAENILVSVIQSTQELSPLTKSDYDTLRQKGISSKVAAEIAMRIKALNKASEIAATEKNDSEATLTDTTNSAIPTVSADDAGDQSTSTNPASDANSDLMAEKPNDANSETPNIIQGTVLSPIETSNALLVLNNFFETLENTYLVEAELARRYAEMRDETDALEDAMSELPAVAQYRREIRDGAPIRALDSCLSMLNEIPPGMDTAIGAALRQCIGEALGALGAYGMGAAYLDAALQSTATVEDYAETFKTFLDYAHRSDYSSTAPLRIAAHEDEISKNHEVGDAYRYFIAYSLVYGPNPNIDMAYRTLEAIAPGSIEYARAQLLMATLDVRSPAFRFKTAAEHVGKAISTLETLPGDTAYQLRNTAWLTLARIAAENHAYDAATSFYNNVDIRSHRLRTALIEQAWTDIFSGQYAHALSLTHTLRAPIFALSWLPDMLLIEANAYLGLCRYGDSQRAIEALRATYIADGETLAKLLAQTPARDYYGQVLRHANSPETSPIPARIYARVLSDISFKRVHQSLQTLNRERDNLSRYVSQNFTFWPDLEKTYNSAITYRQTAIAQVLKNLYTATLDEIHALDVSTAQVAIEIKLSQRKREAECLKIVASGGKCDAQQNITTTQLTKAPDEAFWTFDREFWRDELRAYAVAVPSMCPVAE